MSEIKTKLTLQDNFTNHLKNLHSNMKDTLAQFGALDKAASKMGQIFGKMGQFTSKMAGKFKQPFVQLGQAITNMRGKSRVLDSLMQTFGNLGNRVKSSLSGVLSHVRNFASKLPGAFKQASSAVKQFGDDFKNAFNRMKSSAQQSGSVFKSVLGATGVAALVGNAINQVKALSSAAMQSSDSMDKFASTMQFAGIDNNQISEATKQLKAYADLTVYDNADAFNTAAQLAANGISNYVDMTKAAGNLNAVAGGTKETFKSLNLALVQTVGAGKLTTENWNQITDAIPGASGKLQQAMRDAGAFTGDFREAMADGEITANEFTDAILKLGNMQAALEAAQSTKTFEGAFGALESNVVDNINKVVNAIGKDKLVGIINGTSELVTKATDKLIAFGSKMKPYADILTNSFNRLKAPVQSAVQAVLSSLGKLNGGLGSQQSLASFQNFVDGIVNGITKLAQFVERNSDSIAKFISMLPKLATAFVGFKIGKGVVGNLFNFSAGILGMVGATGKLLVNLSGIFKFGKKKVPMPEIPTTSTQELPGKSGKNPFNFEKLFDGLGKYGKRAVGFASIFATIKLISEASKALKSVYENIPDDLTGLAVKFGAMSIAIGAMGGLVAIAGKIANANKGEAIAGLASIAGISVMLMLAAESMRQINDKVPANIGKFSSKIANMAIAIGSFALLTGAVGTLTSSGIGALVAGAGFASIILLCAEMVIVSKAISKLNTSIPSNFDGLKNKLATISQVIGYFNQSNLGNGFNLIGNVVSTANVAVISKTISAFVSIAKQLTKLNAMVIPTGVSAKISQLQKVLGLLQGGSLKRVFSSKFEQLETKNLDTTITSLLSIAKKLQKIGTIPIVDSVSDKVKNLQKAVSSLNDGSLSDVFGSKFTQWDTGNIDKTLSSLNSIAKKLQKLNEITVPNDVSNKVKNIQKAVSSLSDTSFGKLVSGKFEQWNTGNIDKSLSALQSIGSKLEKIQSVKINVNTVKKKIESIKKAIEPLNGGFWNSLGQMFSNGASSGNYKKAGSAVDSLVSIASGLYGLEHVPFDEQSTISKIRSIKRVVEALSGKVGKIANFKNAVQAVDQFIDVSNKLVSLQHVPFNETEYISKIQSVKRVIKELGGKMVSIGSYASAGNAVNQLISIANNLSSLQLIPFNEQATIEKIQSIKSVLNQLGEGMNAVLSQMGGTEGYTIALQSIQKVHEIANVANQLVGIEINTEAIIGNINKVKEIINAMNSIGQGSDGGAGLTATVQAFNNLITVINQLNATTQTVMSSFVSNIQNGMSQSVALINAGKDQMVQAFNGLSAQLNSAGIFAMQGLTSGIQSGAASAIAAAQNVAHQISSTISSALKINSPSRVMMEIGGFVSQGLAIGLNRELFRVQNASRNLAIASMPQGIAAMDNYGQVDYQYANQLSNVQMNQLSANQGVVSSSHTTTTLSPTINVTVNGGGEIPNARKIADEVAKVIVNEFNSNLR